MPKLRNWLSGAIRQGLRDALTPPPAPSDQAVEPDAGGPRLDPEQVNALVIFWLVALERSWAHRRIESCRFVDEQTVHRHVSVDFTLPYAVQIEGPNEEVTVSLPTMPTIPLGFLKKEPLTNFSVRDADGRPVAMLTTEQNSTLTADALVAYAQIKLGDRPEVEEDLRAIVRYAGAAEDSQVLKDFASAPDTPRPGSPPAREAPGYAVWRNSRVEWERHTLWQDTGFKALFEVLAEEFIVLVDLPVRPGDRTVVKFSYDHAFEAREPVLRWLGTRLGLVPLKLEVEIPAAGHAASYHVEVEAPADLEIRAMTAKIEGGGDEVGRRGGSIGRAHLHLPRVAESPEALTFVELQRQRAGFLRPAAFVCFLTTALLLGWRTRLDVVAEEVEAASTLLLLVPGLLAVWLAQPGEHGFASSVLAGARVMVFACGISAMAAGALLVAHPHAEDREFWWMTLSFVSAFATMFVIAANVLPTKRRDP